MADRQGLRLVGFAFGAITAAIILVAGAVVDAHVDGRLTLDGAGNQRAELFSAAHVR